MSCEQPKRVHVSLSQESLTDSSQTQYYTYRQIGENIEELGLTDDLPLRAAGLKVLIARGDFMNCGTSLNPDDFREYTYSREALDRLGAMLSSSPELTIYQLNFAIRQRRLPLE